MSSPRLERCRNALTGTDTVVLGGASRNLPLLELTNEVIEFARVLVKHGSIPEHQSEDALHVAAAVVHGIDYLLTWNLAHIAKAEARNRIEGTCRSMGYQPPIICTPEELLER